MDIPRCRVIGLDVLEEDAGRVVAHVPGVLQHDRLDVGRDLAAETVLEPEDRIPPAPKAVTAAVAAVFELGQPLAGYRHHPVRQTLPVVVQHIVQVPGSACQCFYDRHTAGQR